jgi:hypothetical protein
MKVGDWVRSVRVCRKDEFTGQIVDTLKGAYVVRDAEKRRWLREASELTPIKQAQDLSHVDRNPFGLVAPIDVSKQN